ncbi:MAG: hypothetical protein U9N86_00320 [Bacteroidota bacterium]|nr:hypothetical protein [Bacteroidota bacterium]
MKVRNLIYLPFLFLIISCQNQQYSWETDHIEITVDKKGYVVGLTDIQTNYNYCLKNISSPLIQIRKDSVLYQPHSFGPTGEEGLYQLSFDNLPAKFILRIKAVSTHITISIEKLEDAENIDLAIWGPYANTINETIGEVVGVVRNSEFAIGIQTLSIRTLGGYPSQENDQDPAYNIFESNSIVDVSDSVKVLYRGQTAKKIESGSVLQAYVRDRSKTRVISNWNHERYVAPAFDDQGIEGSSIALFGSQAKNALETIGNIEIAEGLPHPMIDGQWGKTARSATASYLIMNFGEDNLDLAMNLTKQAGLKYLYHGGPFINWGHFELNTKEFPDNWESMARCVERAEKEGLLLGLHTLSNFITTNDPYVSPKPDPRLAKVGSSNILADISIQDTEIHVESPDFFNQMKNNTLHAVVINDEIIRYREVSESDPWILIDCERGAYGTEQKAHAKGSVIAKLMDHGYSTFLTNSELSKEVALQIADLYNQTGLKQISFDGLEGNWSTGMGQYGRQLFVKYWYEALNPDLQGKVITDASNPGHYFWHMYTRMNWGEPWYAGFRESQTQYRLLNQAFYQRNLMPSMLGWFRMTPEISIEDIEWLLARAAGFDAGFALVTGPAVVENHGMGNLILNTIKIWEEARMAGAFPEEFKKDLQNIQKEFHLETNGPNAWKLYPANVVKAIYKNLVKQPGEPNLLIVDLKNENPDQTVSFVLSSSAESGLSDIQLEIDNFRKILLPLNLPPKHHIKYNGGSFVNLYDSNWNKIDSARIIQDHMTIHQGDHTIQFEGNFTSGSGDIKIEIRTLALPHDIRTK